MTLKSGVEVAEDLASGRLERVLPDGPTAPEPIYALLPSGRLLATKTRVYLDAIVAALGDT